MSHPQTQTYPTARLRAQTSLRTSRFALPLFLLLVSAALFLHFVNATPPALAEERSPDAPGMIAGVVRNDQGEPLAGMEVTLYKLSSGQPDTWNQFRTNLTEADGTYQFSLLLVGIYRVGVRDPQQVYAETYYPAVPTLLQSTTITVLGNQNTNINLTLPPGSRITGLITATVPLTNVIVTLLQQKEEGGPFPYWDRVREVRLPDASSVYSFTGLSATTYRICASGTSVLVGFFECYDNVYDINRATDLKPNVGTTLSNVNIVLADGADYAQISGRVLSTNNEPLANIAVYLVVPPAWPNLPIYNSADFPPSPVIQTKTDSQGQYQLPMVPAGKYTLYFRDPTSTYVAEYYQDARIIDEATVLEIDRNQVLTEINAQLAPGAQIVGLLTILGQPATTAYVVAEIETPVGWRLWESGEVNSNTGRYTIKGLPAGNYRVTASSILDPNSLSYVYVGYFGGDTLETATSISVTQGATVQADIVLYGTEEFDGSISGRITAGGMPVVDLKVSLYRGGDLYCGPSRCLQPVVYVLTGSDGRYTFSGLTTGPFHVGASDPAGIYATTYYTGSAVPARANLLLTDDGQATTGIDIDLPVGGAISGRVTLRKGEPVSGLSIVVYSATQNDIYGKLALISNSIQTDAEGRYTVKGLHADDYLVCFAQHPNADSECYGTAYFDGYGATSGRVTVVSGQTTRDIDLIWGPDLTYYLPIIGQ